MSRISDAFRRARANGTDAGDSGSPDDPPGEPGALVPAEWRLESVGHERDAAQSDDNPDAGTDTGASSDPDAAAERRMAPRGSRHPALRHVAGAVDVVDPAGHALGPVIEQRGGVPPPDPHVGRYWDILRRRWPIGALVTLVVVAGVAAGIYMQEPEYRATGLLEIRPESAVAVPVDTLFSGGRLPADELETQFGILRSAALADRVAAEFVRTGGGLRQAKPGRSDGASDTKPVRPSKLDPEEIRRDLKISPLKGSRLVEVSFDSRDPQLAAWVVNTAFDSYLQLRMEEARRSADWLEEQLRTTQKRLEHAERELQDYIRRRGLQVFETGQGEAAHLLNVRLQSLRELLAKAEAERIEKQTAEEQARLRAAARNLDSPIVQSLSIRLADLRQEHAKLSAVFHDEYPRVKLLKSEIDGLQRELDAEMARVVSRAEADLRAAARREDLLRQALQQQERMVQALGGASGSEPGYEALKRELVTNQQQFALLSQKLKEVGISAALKASNVGIVDRAVVPAIPINAPTAVSLGLALLVGLLLAAGVVVLQEHLDTSIRTEKDVDAYLGVPTLATIPAVAPMKGLPPGVRRPWRRIDRDGRHQPVLNEAFAALRASVLLRDGDHTPRVMLITSAYTEEGKTTVAVNLALSLARLNTRVLLIDANMRFPCVHEALGLHDNDGGLVRYLTGESDWRSSIQPAPQADLDVMTARVPGESPADLLSLPRMRTLLADAAREYDFVLVDSPALLVNPADVQSLASMSDGVLLVVRQGSTPRDAVMLAMTQLGHVDGVVLNRHRGGDLPILRQQDADARTVSAAT
ncbi:MAG TPA: AAA family ATPase [Vicinamibacterales bacterium]|nr:AAA family ATPase [Vicinamibacterales bacterium]